MVLFMKCCFYVCILGFFVQGFPKLLRFQEHHEKILNKFLSKLKQHLVGRCDTDLHPPTPPQKAGIIKLSLVPITLLIYSVIHFIYYAVIIPSCLQNITFVKFNIDRLSQFLLRDLNFFEANNANNVII